MMARRLLWWEPFWVLALAPLILLPGRVLPPAWQLPFAVVPTWWPAQALWHLQAGSAWFWFFLGGGLLYAGALLVWLARRFDAVMHR
ncbi:MAG: hypothetical protein KDE23_05970 [Caldilinea sp.]|nr:hypothetical protein [Caldilinea sp.]